MKINKNIDSGGATKKIDVTYSNNEITISNDGRPIPIYDSAGKIIPEMIFGEFFALDVIVMLLLKEPTLFSS